MSTGKKIFKWIGIIFGALLLIIACFVGFIFMKSSSIFNKTYSYDIKTPVYVPTDSVSLARGERLANVLCACIECHGKDLGGHMFADAMPFAKIYGPNLTFGKGGFDRNNYSVADFDRAVRHGIRKDGRGVFIMPSYHLTYMADQDLGALYAYVRSLPDVDRESIGFVPGPIGKMVMAMGGIVSSATLINHNGKRAPRPEIGPTAEYGKYITELSCVGCHNPNLSGGIAFDADPSWPPTCNLTPKGILPKYTEETFTHFMRTGQRWDGTYVDSLAMPIPYTRQATDDEIHAVWTYLQTIPAADTSSVSWMTTHAP